MLAIEKKTKGHEGKCTPNVLPCRINHNGPVDASKRYWNPIQTPGKYIHSQLNNFQLTRRFVDEKTTAYFRGRKLHGKKVKVPEGYRGVVLSSTDRILPKSASQTEDDEGAEEEPEVKVMEEQSDFDEIMIWGHEAVPEDAADPYVKGMDEWIGLSQQVCYFVLVELSYADGYRFIRISRTILNRNAF